VEVPAYLRKEGSVSACWHDVWNKLLVLTGMKLTMRGRSSTGRVRLLNSIKLAAFVAFLSSFRSGVLRGRTDGEKSRLWGLKQRADIMKRAEHCPGEASFFTRLQQKKRSFFRFLSFDYETPL
jgi:hypothetical protein